MAGRGLMYGGGGGGALSHKRTTKISSPDQPVDSIFASAASSSFVGSRTMVSFGAVKPNRPFSYSLDQDENGDEYFDEYFNHPEKKRRLNADQVQFLEKSFDEENKLEPERKNQLAMKLGLQPRQIAIWFQNRRARSRTKQVETDYEVLLARYNSLKSDYDDIRKENEKLKSEVCYLKDNVPAIDDENGSQQSSMKELFRSEIENPVSYMAFKEGESKLLAVSCSNEDQGSVRSDTTDVGSEPFAQGILTLLHESSHHWQVFEPDQLGIPQTGEDNSIDRLLLSSHILPKVEEAYHRSPANSWNFGLPIEEHHGFVFWPY